MTDRDRSPEAASAVDDREAGFDAATAVVSPSSLSADDVVPSPTPLQISLTPAAMTTSTPDLATAVRAALMRLDEQKVSLPDDAPLGEEWNLVHQGQLAEADLLHVYAEESGLPILDEELYEPAERVPELSYDFLTHWLAIPITVGAEARAVVAVAMPYRLGTLGRLLQAFLGVRPTFLLARRGWVERKLSAIYESSADDNGSFAAGADASAETLKDLAREAPVVRIVNDLFARAVEGGASDIHVEPSEEEMGIRYRIDGIMQTVQTFPMANYAAISSRLKLLANLNIAERRLPQDGRMDLVIGRNQIDVRVSTVPSIHGESVVMRLLQKDASIFDLDRLGMDPAIRGSFERIVKMPHGMVLVVGPTGSGKTTTLYCVMRMLNSDSMKIITLEDPVEYQLPGLTQIQVRSQIGLTFAGGLRAIVRQDPDIILVGEIRDRETAEIAIHAALTGHLVLSTLHTNDAPGAISRLLDMGVEGFLISSALLGVLSQRLLRKICTDCGGGGEVLDSATNEVKRCRACAGSGFRSRIAIFEWMPVDEEIRHAINARRDASEIAAIARKHGMRSLRENGALQVRAGYTTAAEVARVCQLDALEATDAYSRKQVESPAGPVAEC